MDKWELEKGYRHKGVAPPPPAAATTTSPSFSSSLLDAIDRSIDEGGTVPQPSTQTDQPWTNHQKVAYHQQLSAAYAAYLHNDAGYAAHTRFSDVKPLQHHKQPKQRKEADGRYSSVCSASSSSDSSSAGGFSSSEAESVARLSVRTKPPLAVDRSTKMDRATAAAVKAEAAARKAKHQAQKLHSGQQKNKDGSGTIGGRIRASKLYGELKKAKSPVSPGGKLATFLNTLFTNVNTRGGGGKSKSACTSPRRSAQQQQDLHQNQLQQRQRCPAPAPRNPPPHLVIPPRTTPMWEDEYSACSSTASYSRSCLSKTPSTQSGTKRSVRFCPVNVIVDRDDGFLEKKKPANQTLIYPYSIPTSAARPGPFPHVELDGDVEFYDDEDDDGTASCSSSDLFELENLAGVGGGSRSRYADELPVYETTHLHTNRAIAQGLIV